MLPGGSRGRPQKAGGLTPRPGETVPGGTLWTEGCLHSGTRGRAWATARVRQLIWAQTPGGVAASAAGGRPCHPGRPTRRTHGRTHSLPWLLVGRAPTRDRLAPQALPVLPQGRGLQQWGAAPRIPAGSRRGHRGPGGWGAVCWGGLSAAAGTGWPSSWGEVGGLAGEGSPWTA